MPQHTRREAGHSRGRSWEGLLETLDSEWHDQDSERLRRSAAELLHKAVGAISDALSPEAQTHLANAQRELLEALRLIFEESRTRRPRRRGPRGRIDKIDID